MPEPLEPGDEQCVVHGDLAVKDEPVGVQLAKRGHEAWEPARVVEAVPAHKLLGPADLVGQHPPAVHLLFVDPALMMEGLGHQGRVHGRDGRGHQIQCNAAGS